MNNNLRRIFFFIPPCSYSAILSGHRGVKAQGGISEWPRHADCLVDAHPFLKHAKKEIQVQPYCLWLVRCIAKGKRCVLWAVCGLFSRSVRGFDFATRSQIQLSAVLRCCGWYGNLLCVF